MTLIGLNSTRSKTLPVWSNSQTFMQQWFKQPILFEAEKTVDINIWTHWNFFLDRTRLFWQNCTGKLYILRVQTLVWHHPHNMCLSKWVTEHIWETETAKQIQCSGKSHFLLFGEVCIRTVWWKWKFICFHNCFECFHFKSNDVSKSKSAFWQNYGDYNGNTHFNSQTVKESISLWSLQFTYTQTLNI